MYSSLRFMTVLLLCLTCLSYCAPKASAQESYGKTWSNDNDKTEELAITVSAVEEWSNFEWKVFRVDLKNVSERDLQFVSPNLTIEGLSEQPSRVSGNEVNRMISGFTEIKPRGSWDARDGGESRSYWPVYGSLGGNRTANALWGLAALANTASYFQDAKKPYRTRDDVQTISPIKNSDWNSDKALLLAAGESRRRWYALRLTSFQEIEAMRMEMLDSLGKPRSFRATRGFAESR